MLARRLLAATVRKLRRCSLANARGWVSITNSRNMDMRKSNAALRTEDYFRERSSRANIGKAKRILKRAGKGRPSVVGDER